MGRGSSVDIATCYGLGGPGVESRGAIFSASVETGRGTQPTRFLYSGYRVSFPGVKRPGRGVNHSPPSSAEDKE